MASVLQVEELRGSTTGANANKIIIPSGQTLEVAGDWTPPAGTVIQHQYRNVVNSGFSTASSGVLITDWYVDITPKYANSVLYFTTTVTCNLDASTGHARFDIYDSNASAVWAEDTAKTISASGYYTNTGEFVTTPVIYANTAGTTSAMRLYLRLGQLNSGGNFSINWTGGSHRTVSVMEIKQ